MKKTAPKGLSSAELRALRDQRASAPYEAQEASSREQSFLRHLGSAQEDFDWIVANEAWLKLGHDSFASWYLGKVRPAIEALGAQPTRELSEKVLERIRSDEQALPARQRRSAKQLAEVVGLSEWKAEGRKDQRRRGSTADVDQTMNSGNASTPPSGVPGQDSPGALLSASTGLQPANDLEATHPGVDAPAEIPPSQVALVAGQPGSDSSLTGDGASGSDDAERPPVPAAGDEAAEVSTPPPPPKSFTEGQAATPPREPVLPSAEAGVSEADGVEDGPESLGDGPFSTDPASEWMRIWRQFIHDVVSLDADVVQPMLTDDERGEMDDDYPHVGRKLTQLGVWREEP